MLSEKCVIATTAIAAITNRCSAVLQIDQYWNTLIKLVAGVFSP